MVMVVRQFLNNGTSIEETDIRMGLSEKNKVLSEYISGIN
jgi:hypothetical protein